MAKNPLLPLIPLEWHSKKINLMGWLNRSLGREMKETQRTKHDIRPAQVPHSRSPANGTVKAANVQVPFSEVARIPR